MFVFVESLLKGLIIGIFVVMLVILLLVIEVMCIVFVSILWCFFLESKIIKFMLWLWVVWFGLGSFGVLMLWLLGNNLVVVFVGFFSVLIVLVFIVLLLIWFVMLCLVFGLGWLFGLIG